MNPGGLQEYIRNTGLLWIVVSFFCLIWAIVPAYLLNNYRFFGDSILPFALTLPITIPSYIIAFCYRGIFDTTGFVYQFFNQFDMKGMTNLLKYDIQNPWVLAILLSLVLYPYLFVSVYHTFQLQGRQYQEAAQTLGLSSFQVIYKIIFPLSKSAILGGLLLISMELLNE